MKRPNSVSNLHIYTCLGWILLGNKAATERGEVADHRPGTGKRGIILPAHLDPILLCSIYVHTILAEEAIIPVYLRLAHNKWSFTLWIRCMGWPAPLILTTPLWMNNLHEEIIKTWLVGGLAGMVSKENEMKRPNSKLTALTCTCWLYNCHILSGDRCYSYSTLLSQEEGTTCIPVYSAKALHACLESKKTRSRVVPPARRVYGGCI